MVKHIYYCYVFQVGQRNPINVMQSSKNRWELGGTPSRNLSSRRTVTLYMSNNVVQLSSVRCRCEKSKAECVP